VKKDFAVDRELAAAIMSEGILVDRDKQILKIETKRASLSVPITVKHVDQLAQRSGILVGKWLIHRIDSEIDLAWKKIAENVWHGHLGISAKSSTALKKSRRYVMCVYTENYLDLLDVKRVRKKLRNLGFSEELCYKPDIYSYLGIYYKTTELSPCRYKM
jgi:hypothetical protein